MCVIVVRQNEMLALSIHVYIEKVIFGFRIGDQCKKQEVELDRILQQKKS